MKGIVAVLITSLAVGTAIRPVAADPAAQAQVAPPGQSYVVPKSWLDKEISVAEAEAESSVDGVPFGGQNEAWRRLKASIQPGDELWTFCSSWESFQAHAGRCGIAVLRNGDAVSVLITVMN